MTTMLQWSLLTRYNAVGRNRIYFQHTYMIHILTMRPAQMNLKTDQNSIIGNWVFAGWLWVSVGVETAAMQIRGSIIGKYKAILICKCRAIVIFGNWVFAGWLWVSVGVETAAMQIRGSIINGSVRLGAYSNAPCPLICDNCRHEARDGLVAPDICILWLSHICFDTLDDGAFQVQNEAHSLQGARVSKALNFFCWPHVLRRTSISVTIFVFSGALACLFLVGSSSIQYKALSSLPM